MSKLAEAPSPVPLPSMIHGSRFRAALRVLARLVADVRGELTRLLRVVRSRPNSTRVVTVGGLSSPMAHRSFFTALRRYHLAGSMGQVTSADDSAAMESPAEVSGRRAVRLEAQQQGVHRRGVRHEDREQLPGQCPGQGVRLGLARGDDDPRGRVVQLGQLSLIHI